MPLFLGSNLIAGKAQPYDKTPTKDSTNLVESGGVSQAIDNLKNEFTLIDKVTGELYTLEMRNGVLISRLLSEEV